MTTRVRRALVALVLGLAAPTGAGLALGAGATAPASAAAACPAVDVPSSTKTARAVFQGTVAAEPTAAAKTDGSPGALYEQTVTVQTVFQGRIRTSTVQVQTERTPKQCSLGPLTVGQSYLFFAQGDGDPWVAASGAGTSIATPDLLAAVAAILGDGRPPVQPTPEQAVFTSLDPAAPQSLTRSAAPGVALVIVGLLGLVLVRSRRRSR